MPEDLNRTLALAKQGLDELLGLASLDDLSRGKFGNSPKHDRIAELLEKLNTQIVVIQRAFAAVLTEGSSPPVLVLHSSHRAFWNDILSKHASLLRRAYFQISGLDILVDFLDYPSPSDEHNPNKLNAISWGLERWSDMLDENELYEWLDRGFDINGAQAMVAMPWFLPDAWSHNLNLLEPLIIDRPSKVMRDHVRYRLLEIYRSFSFGLWMSSIALSRSLVEFSLRSNAARFGVSTTFDGPGERLEDKSLKRLCEDMAERLPALAEPVEVVRETGNRILHPKKHDVIAHPKVMRIEALECIHAARQAVEIAYSELPPK